jgi:aryl-alcohol dehydrogenase-like predicted oxidoreductase
MHKDLQSVPLLKWQNEVIPQLILGTAQLGITYGIANTTGQPSQETTTAIIQQAFASGCTWLDTAQAYGNSESVLGKSFKNQKKSPTLISKLHPNIDTRDRHSVLLAIQASCQTLGLSSLWGLMLHRETSLDYWHQGLGDALMEAKKAELIQHIGVSIYEPETLNKVLQIPELDIIQLPLNAWDPRFIGHPLFKEAKQAGRLCFLRSAYLQGLMLLPPEKVREKIPEAYEISLEWHQLCKEKQLSPAQLAIRYVKSTMLPIVIGLETEEQLSRNLQLIRETALSEAEIEEIQKRLHPLAKKGFVNPATWSVK